MNTRCKEYYFNRFAKPKVRWLFLFGQFSRILINRTNVALAHNTKINGRFNAVY